MKLPKYKSFKWLREYIEIVIYVIIILGATVWEALLFKGLMRMHQDLIIASIGLQTLNLLLALVVVKKMRLLSQLLLITAILFAGITIYYIKVIIFNVI
jgi:hypothetical protein